MVTLTNLSPDALVGETAAAVEAAIDDAVRAACKGGLLRSIGILVSPRPDGAVTIRVSVNGEDTLRATSPHEAR
jgi:hypothetical protein